MNLLQVFLVSIPLIFFSSCQPEKKGKDLYLYSSAATTSSSTNGNQWILENFSTFPSRTGTFQQRTTIEAPMLIKDASACCGKYAFDVVDRDISKDKMVAFVNVNISDLQSHDAYGGGIRMADGIDLFISNLTIDPQWPKWIGYKETNYDGIDFDGDGDLFGEDITITNWNADGGIDMKATNSQLVRLNISGQGHRALRLWSGGTHYLVDSSINNNGNAGEGSLLWFRDCSSGVRVYIYNSTFNGNNKVPSDKIKCDSGSNPTIIYLEDDPRLTGEMHPMFLATGTVTEPTSPGPSPTEPTSPEPSPTEPTSPEPSPTEPTQELKDVRLEVLNPKDGQSFGQLKDGANYDIAGQTMTIEAFLTGDQKSIKFEISGDLSHSENENRSPYRLFSDVHGGTLAEGTYKIKVSSYTSNVGKGVEQSQTFLITVGKATSVLPTSLKDVKLELLNPLTGESYGLLQDGVTYQIADKVMTIDAQLSGDIQSVKFEISGDMTYSQVENNAPYRLFNNTEGGKMAEGKYTIKVTSFREKNESNMAQSVSYNIVISSASNPLPPPAPEVIQRVMYIDSKTGAIIQHLENGQPFISQGVMDIEIQTDQKSYQYNCSLK